MNEKVFQWIEDHTDDMVRDVSALCSVPSVKSEPEEGKPFGAASAKALNEAAKLCEKYGFTIKNYDNYVATADLDPNLPHSLDILGHMDVVPAGEGWTVTDPFTPIIKDGLLYGRGTSDDKGPVMAALYALRAIKETGVPLKKGIRLILGSDEETGSSDITHYYAVEKEAEMTFSPDAEFPLINIEKGQFRGILKANGKASEGKARLLSLDAGVAFNAVPQKAVLTFAGVNLKDHKDLYEKIEKETGVTFEITGENEVTVIGLSAHGSTPEHGKNAGLAGILLALALPLDPCPQLDLLKNISLLFPWGVTDGSALGIKMSDPESHDLTCTLNLFHVTETEMSFTFDCRTPLMATKENCEDVARAAVEAKGFTFETPGMIPPHAVPGDSDFVQTLLSAYEDVTGLKGECLAIGGGTYVHELKNGVAFGAVLPDIDTRMHGADEFMPISNLVTAAKVFAEAVIRLCGE